MPVAGLVLASTVALLVVSFVTPKPSAATLARFFPGRVTGEASLTKTHPHYASNA